MARLFRGIVLAVGLAAVMSNSPGWAAGGAATAYVRVNQVGYPTEGGKTAVLMSRVDEAGATFSVIDEATGRTVFGGAVEGKARIWNQSFEYVYTLDLSKLQEPGEYRVTVTGAAGAKSETFRIGASKDIYGPLVANAATFYASQRAVHREDGAAKVYEMPSFSGKNLKGALKATGETIDVSGGWYDAGDYLEFVETVSYADAALLMTVRDHPGSPVAAEARRGLEWLLKMWDVQTRTLYYQVGIGDGNEKVRGDHDVWRLPAADDALKVTTQSENYFLKHRPVLRAGATGAEVSPNLAGRLAAAFSLGEQVYRKSDPKLAERCLQSAKTVLASANTDNVKQLLTTSPFEYYAETQWRDDMEWGATELYLSTGDTSYLQAAAHWAKAYLASDDRDGLNLYDVGAVGHYELVKAIEKADQGLRLEVSRQELIDTMHKELNAAAKRAGQDAFGLGLPLDTGDLVPRVIGLALTASFYDELTGTKTYRELELGQRQWVLGGNAWGCSFVVGAGKVFPRNLHHQMANLNGTELTGAVVVGPSDTPEVNRALRDQLEGAAAGPTEKEDAYRIFSTKKVRFADSTNCYFCVEPSLDYAAWSAMLFSREP